MRRDLPQRPRIGTGARLFGLCTAALATLSLTGIEARAAFTTYGFGGASGVFTVSCSGPADGGLPNPGIFDNRNFFQAGSDCTADPLTSSASSNFVLGNASASGSTSASLGSLGGTATMASGVQLPAGPDYVPFPAGFVDTGWIDTMLLATDPSLNGQVGTATVRVDVSGVLSVSGPNVASLLQLVVTSEVANNLGLHTPFHQIQDDGTMPSSLTVSESLFLDLPFIVGTPSQFLVRAQGRAMTSSQTSGANNMSDVNFTSTVTWGGIQSVTVAGVQLSSFTATGTVSGINWALPVQSSVAVPTPGTLPLFATGLVLLVIVGWRTGSPRRARVRERRAPDGFARKMRIHSAEHAALFRPTGYGLDRHT